MTVGAGAANENLRRLGELIRTQRKLAELSQRDLARMVNLSDTYMSQIERGMHEPSVRVLRSLADGLGLGAEQLLTFAAGLSGAAEPGAAGSATDVPTTEESIRRDPRLTKAQKSALLGVLRSYLAEAR